MKTLMPLFWVICICTALVGCSSDDSAPATSEGGGEATATEDSGASEEGSGTTESATEEEAPADEG